MRLDLMLTRGSCVTEAEANATEKRSIDLLVARGATWGGVDMGSVFLLLRRGSAVLLGTAAFLLGPWTHAQVVSEATPEQPPVRLAQSNPFEKFRKDLENAFRDAAKKGQTGAQAQGTSPQPATAPSAPSATAATTAFDGDWYSATYRYGFRITGNVGVATVSNSPAFKPGDVILKLQGDSANSFIGQQRYQDGNWRAVKGTLLADGSLHMQGEPSLNWMMTRGSGGASAASGAVPTPAAGPEGGRRAAEAKPPTSPAEGGATRSQTAVASAAAQQSAVPQLHHPSSHLSVTSPSGLKLRVLECGSSQRVAVALPESVDPRTSTQSGVYKSDKVPTDGLMTALLDANAGVMKACAASTMKGRGTEFYVFPGNLPPSGTSFLDLKKSPLGAVLYTYYGDEWHIRNPIADNYRREQEQQAFAARQKQQQAEREAAAAQEKQRQEQARRDAAKACKSAASQLARQEPVQEPRAALTPAARLTEAEATRLIREKLGLPRLVTTEFNGIREGDPLYPEVFCLVAEGFVRPGQAMMSGVVLDKGKHVLGNLYWSQVAGGSFDFWPYTHRVDVRRIESILSDSQSNTARVSYELAFTPTEYFEKLKQIDPRRVGNPSMPVPSARKETIGFKKWDQGWLPTN